MNKLYACKWAKACLAHHKSPDVKSDFRKKKLGF